MHYFFYDTKWVLKVFMNERMVIWDINFVQKLEFGRIEWLSVEEEMVLQKLLPYIYFNTHQAER